MGSGWSKPKKPQQSISGQVNSTEDVVNQARLTRILKDTCQNIMRDILLNIFQNESKFESRLKKCTKIQFYSDEKEILFPPQGQCSFKKFDFSLAYKICRNVCPNEINPSKSTRFGAFPNPSDKSLLASIERLRIIRNEDAHRTKAAIPNDEFEDSWKKINEEIENIERLLNLGNTHSAEMKKFKTVDIDPRTAELERQVFMKEKELQELKENREKMHGDELKVDSKILQELSNLRRDLDYTMNTGAQIVMDAWETDDDFFVETNSYREARSYLETHHKLMLKGRSGDGKTAMAMHLVFHYVREKDFRLSIIHTPADLLAELQGGKDIGRIILADDIFASYAHGLSCWEEKADYINQIFSPRKKFNSLYFIMTCRSDVLWKVQNKYTFAFIEPKWTVDLITIGRAEKKIILETMMDHCCNPPNILDKDLEDIADYETPLIGFPQCAKMFIFESKYSEKGIDFFQKPIDFLMEIVRKEATKKPAAKLLFMLLLLQGERHVEVNNIEECRKVFMEHGIEEHYGEFSGKEYIMTAEKLLGNILQRESGNCFRFSHALYKETVELYFAGENPKFALNYVDIRILLDKVRFKDRIENPRGAVLIEDIQRRKLFVNKVLDEIWDGNIKAICRYGIFDDAIFIRSFVESFSRTEEDADQHKFQLPNIMNCEDRTYSGNILDWLVEEGKGKMSSELLQLCWTAEEHWQSKEEKSTLLIFACKHDSNTDLVQLLLRNGAQNSFCAACNALKETNSSFHLCPLEEAASNKCEKLVMILLAAKATIPHLKWPCWEYLHKAAEHEVLSVCCSEFILTIMKHAEVDVESVYYNISQSYLKLGQDMIKCADADSFFLICCKYLHLNNQCMDFFKELDINFNVKDNHQNNAFHTLVSCPDDEDRVLKVIDCLHKAGCDINARDSQGKTPLARCLLQENVPNEVVDLLLEKGASLTAIDNDRKSPAFGFIASGKEDSDIHPVLEVITKYMKNEYSELHKLLKYAMTRNKKLKMCFKLLKTFCKESQKRIFEVIRQAILSQDREDDIINLMAIFEKEIQYGLVRRNETILTLILQHRATDEKLLKLVLKLEVVQDAQFDRGDTLLTRIAKMTVDIGASLEHIIMKWNLPKALLNKANDKGDTMLHLLVQNRACLTDVIEKVLELGASIDNKNQERRNVMHCLILSAHDDEYCCIILNIFRKYSKQFPKTLAAKDKDLYTPVMIAFLKANSRFSCIKLFLENYYRESCVKYVDLYRNNAGHHIAMSDLDDDNSHWVLEKAAKDIEFGNSNDKEQIPVHCEIKNEKFRPKSLGFLLSKTTFGKDIFERIVQQNRLNLHIAQKLLTNNSKLVFTENPFLVMSKCDSFEPEENIDSVINHFSTHGFNINATDGNGNTPILHACRKNKSLKFIQALVASGASVNVRNFTDETCLHLCMSSSRDDDQTFELVKVLALPDTVNSEDHRKETPIMRAARSSCPRRKAMKYLSEKDANFRSQDIDLNSVVHHCIDSPKNDEQVVQLLQDMPKDIDLGSCNNEGLTPLNLAAKNCKRSRIRTLAWLLHNEAEFERTDQFGRSPFYNAISCMESMNPIMVLERMSRLVLFVTYHVPHNKSDRNGRTPMKFASEKHLSDVNDLLESINSPYSDDVGDHLESALNNFIEENPGRYGEQPMFEEGFSIPSYFQKNLPKINDLLLTACHLLKDVCFDEVFKIDHEIQSMSDVLELDYERQNSNLTIISEEQAPFDLQYGQVDISNSESSESEDRFSIEGPLRFPRPSGTFDGFITHRSKTFH